jgi:hypothetical protein
VTKLAVRALVLTFLTTLFCTAVGRCDSIFDSRCIGRDIIPAVGATRSLGGAVAANPDPTSSSIANPCASARAKHLTFMVGIAHTGTTSNNFGEEKKTITTLFPSLALVVPLKRFSILTGLFLEKEGRIRLAEADTLYPTNPDEDDAVYDASYRRESSFNSVPIFVSTSVNQRLILSAGILFSFCDMREEMILNFRPTQYTDTDDIMDTFAMGHGFATAFLLDLDRFRLRVGGLFRTAADLDGKLERRNRPKDLWSTQDITISSHEAFRLGLRAEPIPSLAVEVDFDRNPWSRLKLNDHVISDRLVERWSAGIQYRGDYIWRASKYPLNLGYYSQPLDWGGTRAGRITEEVFSFGTSIPTGTDRAAITLTFEIGTRRAETSGDFKEKTYGLSLSISSIEPWQREIKRQ